MVDKKIIKLNHSDNNLISKTFQLKYFPIGIKFVKKGGNIFKFPRAKNRKSICAFIKIAVKGAFFYLDKDSISCPGGLKWMGFPSKITETYFYKFFLGKLEKIKSSPEIAEKFIDFLPKPPEEGLYGKMLFTPLKICQFKPDVVIIITTPRYAYQIIIASYLDEYHLVKTIPICAACHGAISIPFTTGELNVSMIDPMSRELGGYKDEEILIGIPYPRFISLIKNIEKTSYNTQKESIFTKFIKEVID